jgi:hypothetical protein
MLALLFSVRVGEDGNPATYIYLAFLDFSLDIPK